MSWLIIDTNEACNVKRLARLPTGVEGFKLSPLVFGEIIDAGRVEWLHAIARFHLQFGRDPADLWRRVSTIAIDKLPSFSSFLSKNESRSLRSRMRRMKTIPDDLWREAERVKAINMGFKRAALATLREVREQAAKSGEAMPEKEWNVEAELKRSEFDVEPLKSFAPDRRAAALRNSRIRRFHWMINFYYRSVHGLWKDQSLNRDTTPKDDEWPDMTNLLYAADGDAIVTLDGWFRRAVTQVEKVVGAASPVRCVSIEELMAQS